MQLGNMKIIGFILILLHVSLYATKRTFTCSDEKAWGLKNTTLSCYTEGVKAGTIECLHLPLSFYVVHSFYVYPDYRNQGIGKALLARICKFLKNERAYQTYLQPGPFELDDGDLVHITDKQEYQDKIKKLVALYGSVGFKKVSTSHAVTLGMFYTLFQMPEDARYLMVLKRSM